MCNEAIIQKTLQLLQTLQTDTSNAALIVFKFRLKAPLGSTQLSICVLELDNYTLSKVSSGQHKRTPETLQSREEKSVAQLN